jgi:serine/threonine protein kinase
MSLYPGERIQEGGYGVVVKMEVNSVPFARKYFKQDNFYVSEVRWNQAIGNKEGSDDRTKYTVKMLRFGFDKTAKHWYFDMELAGKALFDIAVQKRRLSGCPEISTDVHVEQLISDTLNGLEFLQSSVGMLHNDIKPENILLKLDGTYAYCDFGVATKIDGAFRKQCGTEAFAAPEHYDDSKWSVDGTSDVFSLGITLLAVFDGYGGVPLPPAKFTDEDRQCIEAQTDEGARRAMEELLTNKQRLDFFKNKFRTPTPIGRNLKALPTFKWQFAAVVTAMVQPFNRPGCKELLEYFHKVMLESEPMTTKVERGEVAGNIPNVTVPVDDVKCTTVEGPTQYKLINGLLNMF